MRCVVERTALFWCCEGCTFEHGLEHACGVVLCSCTGFAAIQSCVYGPLASQHPHDFLLYVRSFAKSFSGMPVPYHFFAVSISSCVFLHHHSCPVSCSSCIFYDISLRVPYSSCLFLTLLLCRQQLLAATDSGSSVDESTPWFCLASFLQVLGPTILLYAPVALNLMIHTSLARLCLLDNCCRDSIFASLPSFSVVLLVFCFATCFLLIPARPRCHSLVNGLSCPHMPRYSWS